MTAIVLRHPNADATPPPRRGPGRLPNSVAFLPKVRRNRAIEARDAEERQRKRSEHDIVLHQQIHNCAVAAYRNLLRNGRPDTFADALRRVKSALNTIRFDDDAEQSDGAA